MSTAQERKELLEIMVENGRHSEWEKDFLYSIIEQLEAGRQLSEKQEEKLLQIQRKE